MSSPEASAIDRSDTNRRRNTAADETHASIATRITTPFSLHADPAPQACGFCSCRFRGEPEVGTRDDPRCRTECVKARILPQLIRSKVALPAGCSPVRPLRSRTSRAPLRRRWVAVQTRLLRALTGGPPTADPVRPVSAVAGDAAAPGVQSPASVARLEQRQHFFLGQW